MNFKIKDNPLIYVLLWFVVLGVHRAHFTTKDPESPKSKGCTFIYVKFLFIVFSGKIPQTQEVWNLFWTKPVK